MLLVPLSLWRTQCCVAAGQRRCVSVNRLQVYILDRIHDAMVRTGPVLALDAVSISIDGVEDTHVSHR